MIANRWQVEWVSRDGLRHLRTFKIESNARDFADHVKHAPWNTPEVWEMVK